MAGISSKNKAVVLVGVFAIFLVAMEMMVMQAESADISCGTVTSDLIQCVGYLTSGQGKPNPNCCGGVKKLAGLATTTPARRTVCNCLKKAYSQFPNVNSAAVSNLPGSCGVNLPFKISPQTDCSTIN
uniref:Non-specific lipid-transfer protein n=1 Tax=Picea sitchensis TaxID=3332 RepID=B8LRP3_PICSI|nr:unknown [Picea sitchensis]